MSAHCDPSAVGAEKVIRVLERNPVRIGRGSSNRDQRGAFRKTKHTCLVVACAHYFELLKGFVRADAVLGFKQLIQRSTQWLLRQPRESFGWKASVLKGNRHPVGKANTDKVKHQ